MRRKQRSDWADLLNQFEALLDAGDFEPATRTLQAALRLGRSVKEFDELRKLLQQSEHLQWLESEVVSRMHADVLLRALQFDQARVMIETRLFSSLDSRVLALHALILLRCQSPAAALAKAELALRSDASSGLAWRVKAEAVLELGLPNWNETFGRATSLLAGRAKGLCLIEWGRGLEANAEHGAARSRWAQALPSFDDDAHYRALITHNLGLSCARDLRLEEAEAHFSALLKFSKHPDAKAFESRAWCGFGLARRVARELTRAADAYQRATRLLSDHDPNAIQAWRGWGHTLRLMGRPSQALEKLQRALDVQEQLGQIPWVRVDLAAALLAEGAQTEAVEILPDVHKLRGEDLDRYRIVQAEVARLDGNANLALEHCAELRWQSLWVREELEVFPALRTLLQAMNQPVSQRMPLNPGLKVEVFARGSLRIKVNGRPIHLEPTSRAGQVLVLLLHYRHERTIEELLEDFFPDTPQYLERGRRKKVSRAVVDLRRALGAEDSVQERNGSYRLSDEWQWVLDIREALDKGEMIGAVMVGVDSDWVGVIKAKFEHENTVLN